METTIHRIRLGICNCYVIQEKGLILVDAGQPEREKTFLSKMKELSLNPRDISLIFLTHGHSDHAGSLRKLKEITGAQVAINFREVYWIEEAVQCVPPGVGVWGRFCELVLKKVSPHMHFEAANVDIILEDKGFPLDQFGINGKILYTPGHSSGSMSLLLDSGDAFVGDAAMSGFPRLCGAGKPVCADDIEEVTKSWQLLLDKGAQMIYPAHGKPFRAEVLKKIIEREKK